MADENELLLAIEKTYRDQSAVHSLTEEMETLFSNEDKNKLLDTTSAMYDQQKSKLLELFNLEVQQIQKTNKLKVDNNYFVLKAENNLREKRLNNAKELYSEQIKYNNVYYQELTDQLNEYYEKANEANRALTEEELNNIEKIEKKRQDALEYNSSSQFETNVKKVSNTLADGISNAIKTGFKNLGELATSYINNMWFNQMEAGFTKMQSAYEGNFTELAGRTGSDRAETHSMFEETARLINANDNLAKGLNLSDEVIPSLVEATKQGFMGEEAIEVAITNATDKKLLPWLETSSETWSDLQYHLSDDALQQIKGQQLLLQETRAGNRLLQTGVVDTLLDDLKPLLINIDTNTFDEDNLMTEAQAIYSYLTENEDFKFSKKDALDIVNTISNAYSNPYEAINNGTTVEKYLGTLVANNPNMTFDELAQAYGDFALPYVNGNWATSGAVTENLGINTGGITRNTKSLQALANLGDGTKEFMTKFESTSNENTKAYTDGINSLEQKVTATAAHDNDVQNEWGQKLLDALKTPHGSDTEILILQQVKQINTNLINFLIGDLLGNLVGNALGKWAQGGLEKLGSKILGKFGKNVVKEVGEEVVEEVGEKALTSAGKGAAGTAGTTAVNTVAINFASVAGGVLGAAKGISETVAESKKMVDTNLADKDKAKNTQAYKDYEQSLKDKAAARNTGAVVGGIAGGAAGAAGGAMAGAAIGSIVPVYGTAIGAAVGGFIGFLGGLFGAKIGESVGDMMSPIESVLTQAAVDSLDKLSILENDWDKEISERENLVSAMSDCTDIETQKRMLLDAGIDSNLVNMAKTDKELDNLAKSALNASKSFGDLADASADVALDANNTVNTTALGSISEKMKNKSGGGKKSSNKELLEEAISTAGISGEDYTAVTELLDKYNDGGGIYDGEMDDLMAELSKYLSEDHIRRIAKSYDVSYDTMTTEYLDELVSAIQVGDKEAAEAAIKLLKADKLSSGGNALDYVKANDTYVQQLEKLGIDVSSYRTGSSYIPHDGYAYLHQGERVLTSTQNKEFESLQGRSIGEKIFDAIGTGLSISGNIATFGLSPLPKLISRYFSSEEKSDSIQKLMSNSNMSFNDIVKKMHSNTNVNEVDVIKEKINEIKNTTQSSGIIEKGVQDIVVAIKNQTNEIINYLSTSSFTNPQFGKKINMTPTMGNIKSVT